VTTHAASRWDARYAARGLQDRAPAAILPTLSTLLPRRGRALDLAGGDGRNALWLARRGLELTVADASAEGLRLAAQRLAAAGLPVDTVQVDLEDPQTPWPDALGGGWDLVLVSDFLSRPLLAALPAQLAPGGVLVISHPTRRNLERHPHPSARFLLQEGELPGLIPGLDILHHDSAWRDDDRHVTWLVGRRPG